MIRDLVVRSVEKYGGDEELAQRLLSHGDKQYTTWVVRSLIGAENINASLEAMATLLDVPLPNIRYAYFTAQSRSRTEIRRLPEYKYVIKMLLEIRDIPELWQSLLKYAFRQLKRLAIEQMVERGESALEIMNKLNVSNGLVYKVRSAYIKKVLTEKANV